ncbi:hypothetical protein R5W23_003072 [Gemmata sp. JC673]|uniref:DUF4129 domain-containing protein n=1 Tax=Gemmata algarum TaxID=2975278 RepID=A0ABU5ETM4_9BACT|nr:hypothetical protein [Gemmata algarum]MDY3557807.1 hypothetical protein [Gemmata algarum]
MSAGRRGLILSAGFALLALGLPRTAHGQPPPPFMQFRPNGFNDPQTGRHTIWQHHLTTDRIRELFSQYGQDDAASKQLEKMIRDAVKKNNPNANDERLNAAIQKALADKEFMNRLVDMAQKRQNDSNRAPGTEFVPAEFERDLARLREQRARNGRPDPLKAPKIDPTSLPKFDPKSFDPNNFDPEQFPFADPQKRPRIDPNSGLPLDRRTGRPYDPRTGQPLDPLTGEPLVPKGAPRPPEAQGESNPNKVGDPNKTREPDKTAPKQNEDQKGVEDAPSGRPIEPRPPEPEPEFDPERPQPPRDSPERLAQQKAYEAASALWEKNVGPLDESPAVKRAIYDLISDREAMDALTDGKGNSLFDMFKDGIDGDGLKDLFGGLDGKWEWPKLDWKLDWGKNTGINLPDARPRSRWPDTSGRWPSNSNWGGWGSFNFGGVQVPWLLFVPLLALVVAVVVWWKWAAIARLGGRGRVAVADGLGPWPVDPRAINSREDVVKAFEYLSVLICGPGAKTWTHSTVADELTVLARTQPDAALTLARLYELARYAPLDEPLSRAELLEARRLVCDLAEMG